MISAEPNPESITSKYYYPSGLPFSEIHAQNLDAIKNRVLNENKGGVIIIGGLVGTGKTSFAIHNADYVNGAYKKVGREKYELVKENLVKIEDVLVIGTANLSRKLVSNYDKGLHVVVWDEAGDYNNRSFLTRLNQEINRLFEISRAFKIVVFVCLPNFYTLDKNIFNVGVIQGVSFVYSRNRRRAKFKVFDIANTYKLMFYMSRSLDKVGLVLRWRPNYFGEILPLTPERQAELDNYSILGKKSIAMSLFKDGKKSKKALTLRGGGLYEEVEE